MGFLHASFTSSDLMNSHRSQPAARHQVSAHPPCNPQRSKCPRSPWQCLWTPDNRDGRKHLGLNKDCNNGGLLISPIHQRTGNALKLLVSTLHFYWSTACLPLLAHFRAFVLIRSDNELSRHRHHLHHKTIIIVTITATVTTTTTITNTNIITVQTLHPCLLGQALLAHLAANVQEHLGGCNSWQVAVILTGLTS